MHSAGQRDRALIGVEVRPIVRTATAQLALEVVAVVLDAGAARVLPAVSGPSTTITSAPVNDETGTAVEIGFTDVAVSRSSPAMVSADG